MEAIAEKVRIKTPLWRTEDPVLDDKGVLVKGGMFRHQRDWWNLPNFIRLLVTGYGGGKTLVLCKRMVALTLENAPVPCAIVSPTYTMAKETVIATLEEILSAKADLINAEEGPKSFRWRMLKESPYKFFINYHGRSNRLLVYSGEEPVRLKGSNLAAVGIDEPFIQHEDVFTQMMARTRHPRARKKEINLSGTPEQLNWGYDLAEGEMSKKHDVGVVKASTRENLVLTEDYAERLSAVLDEKAQLAYIEGQFINLTTGLVYYAFNKEDNVVEMPFPKDCILGGGMDFNVNPMAAAVFWRMPNHIHYFDEIELPNSDTQEMCTVLKERYWESGLRRICPDPFSGRATNAPGGKTDYAYIEEAGFELDLFPKNQPLRRDRFNASNGMMRAKDGKVRLTVSPRCKRLIKYFQLIAYENLNKEECKRMTHLTDAATYPVAYFFPVDKKRFLWKSIRGV